MSLRNLLALLLIFVSFGLPRTVSAWTPLHVSVWDMPQLRDSVDNVQKDGPVVYGLAVSLGCGQVERLHGLGVGLLGTACKGGMYGLQAGGLGSVAVKARGAQVSGLGNVVNGGLTGVQLSGLGNVLNGRGMGLQVTGLGNVADGAYMGMQVAGLACVVDGEMGGVQISGLASLTDGGIHGIQLAGLASVADGGMAGAQVSGLASLTDGGIHGIQLAGVAAVADGGMTGVQASALVAVTDEKMTGIQAAGLVSVADGDFYGLQAGLLNVARKAAGVQLGLVNVAEELHGVPLGLVSVVPDGIPGRETWVDESGFVSVGYRSGSRRFYNLVYLSLRPGSTWRWTPGWGCGARFFLPGGDYLETGIELSHLNEGEFWTDKTNFLGRVRALWVRPLKGDVSLFAGPSLNYLLSSVSDGSGIAPWSVYSERSGSRYRRLWPGLSLGLRFNS